LLWYILNVNISSFSTCLERSRWNNRFNNILIMDCSQWRHSNS